MAQQATIMLLKHMYNAILYKNKPKNEKKNVYSNKIIPQ